MPVLRKTINLTVSGNTLLAADSVTSTATSDAGVQGEDEAVLFHVTVPTDWQDLSVRLKVMSQDGGYDLSDLPVANAISMPLRQGLTMASGRLTVSLVGSTTAGVRKSADCKTLIVAASAQEIDPISHIYPYPVRHITGSGGALVTQTDNETYNVDVTGTGGDMLQANYANGNVSNPNTVDVSKSAKAAQAGSALETVIAAKMPIATYAAGTGHANTSKIDHAIAADTADAAYAGSALESILKTGWIPANETWVYASVSTITVPTGAASRYQKGDKIQFTQTTVKYFYVVAVADTLLTVTGGSDYTVTNVTISSIYYSHELNPLNFPGAFNYAPTVTWTNGPTVTTDVIRFSIAGRICTVRFHRHGTANASTSAMLKITLPIPTASIYAGIVQYPIGSGTCTDNVTFIYSCAAYLLASDMTITMEWTAGKPVNGNILAIYEI